MSAMKMKSVLSIFLPLVSARVGVLAVHDSAKGRYLIQVEDKYKINDGRSDKKRKG